ncbi:MAG: CarD family transcriptional regulator, partial [Acidimicrobiales bacterium]
GRPRGGSLTRDFMVLGFAGGDRLFVPVDRVQRRHLSSRT